MNRPMSALLVAAAWCCISLAQADEPAAKPTPSKHQMMKDCMAKQKASDGGMPKEDMKRNCRDVTATERENDKAEDKAEKVSEESADAPKK
jgi:hypothetical protein